MPIFCRKCGTALFEGSAFCSACGTPVNPERSVAPLKPSGDPQYSIVGKPINPTQNQPLVVHTQRPFRRGLWLGVVLGVAALVLLFATWSSTPSGPAATSAAPTSESPMESFVPPLQKSFTSIVESFIPGYNSADTEIRKTNVRFERKAAIVRYFSGSGSLRFQGWVGEVHDLKTESDGKAALSVKLKGSETVIKTWNNSFSDSSSNTMISRGDGLYPSLMDIKNEDEVTVSGAFVVEGGGQDYVKELSVTEAGSMTSPEFLVRFSQIGKGSARTSSPLLNAPAQMQDSNPVADTNTPDSTPVSDGRTYSVALIDANTQSLSAGAKVFVQGTVLTFTDGVLVIQDEGTNAKLGCKIKADQYETDQKEFAVGESVRVLGEYVGVSTDDRILRGIALFRNCTVNN
jgi:hypothetical protein